MHIAGGEKLQTTRLDPTVPGHGLTLRAVAVAARVVRDGAMPAAGALVEMTAECSGTTPSNGSQHFDVLPSEPVTVSFEESGSRCADQIGQLQGWPTHLPFLRGLAFQWQRVQRTRRCFQVTFGQMQVECGFLQVVMA